MKRFIDRVSKVLAVVGVLMLMWTASEMQTAKAITPQPIIACQAVWTTINGDPGWITCAGTTACGFAQQCCHTPRHTGGATNDLDNYECCYFSCPGSG